MSFRNCKDVKVYRKLINVDDDDRPIKPIAENEDIAEIVKSDRKEEHECALCRSLFDACQDGELETVKKLVKDNSTDIHYDAKFGERRWNFLHVASWEGHNDVVQYLLQDIFKDRIDETDRDNDTALLLSTTNWQLDVCRTLFDAGADLMIVNKDGNSALHQACKRKTADMCSILIDKAVPCFNTKNVHGDTPLLVAARNDSVDAFRLLVTKGADHYVRDNGGDTSFHIAASRSCFELCRALIDKGQSFLSVQNKKGETALHKAAQQNKAEICRLLLDAGCDHTLKEEEWGNTALHIAANKTDEKDIKDSTAVCHVFLDKGASWSSTNDNVDTVLHVVAKKLNVEICERLVASGADVLAENKQKQVPLDCVPRSMLFKLDKLQAETDKARFNKLSEETGTTPVRTVKLFLCGDPAAGKTTLKRSITKSRLASLFPRCKPHDPHIATPGVNVKPQRISGVGMFVIWDMAGQIEYHVTHAMLLGSSSGVFIVVFDISKDKERIRERLMYWLCFIKAGHDPVSTSNPSVMVVATHFDFFKDNEEAATRRRQYAEDLLKEFVELFKEFLDIYDELLLVDSRFPRTRLIRRVKEVIKKLADPMRKELTPNICAQIAKQTRKWGKKAKIPVMNFNQFLEKVNKEIDIRANDRLVRLAISYLHRAGEVHCANVKQDKGEIDQRIILNPNWLTTSIFGPIFADPSFRDDYVGLEEKQVYTVDDLRQHFSASKLNKENRVKLLVELLQYFELAYRRNDATFIIPVKLPPGVEKIEWADDPCYINYYGLRIECRDRTDIFSVDTFPCLQVRAMSTYKQENIDPTLSHQGVKVIDQVEGMIQLSDDKRAIHLAVRVKEKAGEQANKDQARRQLHAMKDMLYFELNERSIGTRVNLCYLSPHQLKGNKDLVDGVKYYSEETITHAQKKNKDVIIPNSLIHESIQDITGLHYKQILDAVEAINPTNFEIAGETPHHDIPMDNASLQKLSTEIGDWEALGHYLDVKDAEIHKIKMDYSPEQHRYQLLLQWRQMQSCEVRKQEKLRQALENLGRIDLAHGMSDSTTALNDQVLRGLVVQLSRKEWESLAIMLGCTIEEIDIRDISTMSVQMLNLLVKWRRRQPKNIDVVKYMATGLRLCELKDLAAQIEACSTWHGDSKSNNTHAQEATK